MSRVARKPFHGEDLVPIPHMCEVLVPILLILRNWYQFFSCVKNGINSSHVRVIGTTLRKKLRSQLWRIFTNSLHVRNYQWILHVCEELVPILHMCEELVLILHTQKNVAPVLHRCDEYLPILQTSEIINMRNLSTNFRSQNLSKLTIRKFHIWQMDVLVPFLLMGIKFTKLEIYSSTKRSTVRSMAARVQRALVSTCNTAGNVYGLCCGRTNNSWCA